MSRLSAIWEKLGIVQHELKQGTLDTQDTAIAALQDYLDESDSELFPSFVYPQLIDVLRFYCRKILPHLGISQKDQHVVREEFEQTLHHLNVQEQTAKDLEIQFKHLFLQVKSGLLKTAGDVVTALCTIVATIPPLRGAEGCISRQTTVCLRGVRGGFPKELQIQFRTLKKSPFTSSHVLPFFETLTTSALPKKLQEAFACMKDLFWHQLNDLLQMKAVLVHTKTRKALITRLDIETLLKSKGLDTLDFENRVDERMYQSCWNAVQAAHLFLEQQFPDILTDQSIHVNCRFPNPLAEYNDTSASLLVGLKVIGDVLELEIDPHTLVSGELEASDTITSIQYVAKKIKTADRDPDIHHIYLPADGLFVESPHVTIIKLQTFSEAINQYYGEQLQKKMKQISRRQILKGAAGLTAVPFVPSIFSTVKNMFSHPVSEHDLRLLDCARDLYQQKSDYNSAIIILEAILDRFQQDHSSTEVLQLKAFALGQLGVIYLQQHHIEESLSAFRRAAALWESIHDRENQADILFRIGEVYRYTVAINGIRNNSKIGLQYYQHAYELLKPSMQLFTRLRGKYYALSGYMYYWVAEYALAEKYSRKGIESFDEPETNWTYQTSKQHLARTLTKVGKYDEANEILQSTTKTSVLQGPHDRARSAVALSDFFFSIGDQEQGLEFADRAGTLCQEFGLQGQQRILKRILARYGLSL